MKNKRIARKKNRWEKKQNRLVPSNDLDGVTVTVDLCLCNLPCVSDSTNETLWGFPGLFSNCYKSFQGTCLLLYEVWCTDVQVEITHSCY